MFPLYPNEGIKYSLQYEMIVTAFVLWEWPISWRIQPGKVPRKWQEMDANKPFLGSSWNGQYFRNGTSLFSKLSFWSLWSLHHNEYHYTLDVVQTHYSFVLTIFLCSGRYCRFSVYVVSIENSFHNTFNPHPPTYLVSVLFLLHLTNI